MFQFPPFHKILYFTFWIWDKFYFKSAFFYWHSVLSLVNLKKTCQAWMPFLSWVWVNLHCLRYFLQTGSKWITVLTSVSVVLEAKHLIPEVIQIPYHICSDQIWCSSQILHYFKCQRLWDNKVTLGMTSVSHINHQKTLWFNSLFKKIHLHTINHFLHFP